MVLFLHYHQKVFYVRSIDLFMSASAEIISTPIYPLLILSAMGTLASDWHSNFVKCIQI